MTSTTETTTPTTVPPCPAWCDEKAPHEYDTDIPPTGAIERHHNWDAPDLGEHHAAWASIGARESSLNGIVSRDAPYIYASADQEMTALQARGYAAELLLAADKLDEINCG